MAAKISQKSPLENFFPVLVLVSIGLAFFAGVLWERVSTFRTGGTTGTQVAGDTADTIPTNSKLSEAQADKVPAVSVYTEGESGDTTSLTEGTVGQYASDHIRGSKDAKVFMVEYSDLQCPYCANFHDTAKQAVDEYGGDVAWVYRHFPLDSIHPKARPAALASECVAEQGGDDAFWAFTDALFANQATALDDMAGVVGQLGLDVNTFNDCVASEKYADKVEKQYQEGLDAGVTGTPGNFIVNKKGEVWTVPGAVPFATLKSSIDEALGSAS